jgi:hypothetical protein
MTLKTHPTGPTHFLTAVYRRQATALTAVERLIDKDFPMDKISLLGKAYATGDDVLGIYYHKVGERMKAWGEQGAFWGGLWGLLASASGMFIIPGIGAVMAAGPIVAAIANAVAAASITGGALAAAAAISEIAVALHRLGIPQENIEQLHQAIADGKYVLIIQGKAEELADYRELVSPGAEFVEEIPNVELTA